VGDSEKAMPDHQRSAADVIPIDRPIPKPAAPPQIVRSSTSAPGAAAAPPLTVVTNWNAGVKK